jgi:hypothetical protein
VAVGSVPFAFGMMFMVALDTWVPAGSLVVVPLAVAVVVTAGAVALGWAAWHLGRLATASARASRDGYGWTTIAEVIADRRGDTGAVISGSREYAALPASTRERLRRRRLQAAAVLLGAATSPAAIVLSMTFGLASLLAPAAFMVLVFALPFALVAMGMAIIAQEDRQMEDARRRLGRQRPRVDWSALVAGWRGAFELARHGQQLGSGRTGRPRAARMAGLGLAGAAALTTLLALPAVLVGAAGSLTWNILVTGDIGSGRWASYRDLAEVMRPLRPAPDTTLTPEAAGVLFRLLVPDPRTSLPLRPAPASIAPEQLVTTDEPFGVFWGNADTLMRRAVRGFTPAERSALLAVVDDPRIAIVRRLGRARAMDVVGTWFVTPFPDSADAGAMEEPIWGFPPRSVAYTAVAQAALMLSEGRRAAAESLLLETASFGLLIGDEATHRWDALAGYAIVATVRRALASMSAAGSGIDHHRRPAGANRLGRRGERRAEQSGRLRALPGVVRGQHRRPGVPRAVPRRRVPTAARPGRSSGSMFAWRRTRGARTRANCCSG